MSRQCVLFLFLAATCGSKAMQSSPLVPTSTTIYATTVTATSSLYVSPSPTVAPYLKLSCLLQYPHSSSPIVHCFLPEEAVSVECSVDGGAQETCALSMSFSHLSDGNHTVVITAVDINGDSWRTTLSFTVIGGDDDGDGDVQTSSVHIPVATPGVVGRLSEDNEDQSRSLRTSEIVAIVVGIGEVVVAIIFIALILVYFKFIRKRNRNPGLYNEEQSHSFLEIRTSSVIYNTNPSNDLPEQQSESGASVELPLSKRSSRSSTSTEPGQPTSVPIYIQQPGESSSPIELHQPEQPAIPYAEKQSITFSDGQSNSSSEEQSITIGYFSQPKQQPKRSSDPVHQQQSGSPVDWRRSLPLAPRNTPTNLNRGSM